MPSNTQKPPSKEQLHAARSLWFGSYHAILSTHSLAQPGFPFGSLIPLGRDLSGLPLLLLSHLAQHTQNLEANPCCSLTLFDRDGADVQKLGRLTCLAHAEKVDPIEPHLSERYFRFFPESQGYYRNLNFRFYRLTPEHFYFIGGFGAARWFDPSRLIPEDGFSAHEETKLLEELNALKNAANGLSGSDLRIIGADCLGMDLSNEDRLSRLMQSEPTLALAHFITLLESTGRPLKP